MTRPSWPERCSGAAAGGASRGGRSSASSRRRPPTGDGQIRHRHLARDLRWPVRASERRESPSLGKLQGAVLDPFRRGRSRRPARQERLGAVDAMPRRRRRTTARRGASRRARPCRGRWFRGHAYEPSASISTVGRRLTEATPSRLHFKPKKSRAGAALPCAGGQARRRVLDVAVGLSNGSASGLLRRTDAAPTHLFAHRLAEAIEEHSKPKEQRRRRRHH